MYLSLIELGADAEYDPGFWREVAKPDGAHRALWQLFSRGQTQSRDFLFRQEVGVGGRPRFFALSAQPPHGDAGPWAVTTKPFAPKLRTGDRLGFVLCASPTVKRASEKGKPSQRHDVLMDAKRRAKEAGHAFDPVSALQSEGERWLARQGERAGFALDRGPARGIDGSGLLEERECTVLRVDGYRRHRLVRRGHAPVLFSTAEFEGTLVVRDPEVFVAKVTKGFGPQRAFGCGLMLLRRA